MGRDHARSSWNKILKNEKKILGHRLSGAFGRNGAESPKKVRSLRYYR
jgi:hypothetical protein